VEVGKQRNPDCTVYVGELETQVDEELLWELFLQVGPVVYVHIPKDRVTNQHSGFGFVEFRNEVDAEYASKVMGGIKLYGKGIRVNRANGQKRHASGGQSLDVGANLFVGNLGPDVDERVLYDTFSRFGVIVSTPKVMRDPETQESKGFAFVSFADFEASDAAIAALNGQYVAGRPISVAYAIKKDSRGERHGSDAERLLAAQRRLQQGAAAPRPGGVMMGGPGMMMAPPPPQFQAPPGAQQYFAPPPHLQPQYQQQHQQPYGGYRQ
jgi:splicing factor 3B subunit 4